MDELDAAGADAGVEQGTVRGPLAPAYATDVFTKDVVRTIRLIHSVKIFTSAFWLLHYLWMFALLVVSIC